MCLSLTSMLLAAWVCAWLGAASADSDGKQYSKVGGDVILKPGPISGTINTIMWKHGLNIAAEWDAASADGVDEYGQFKGRCRMNTSTGELTISRLRLNDTGVYTAEVNDQPPTQKINLIILHPVPKPSITKVCDTGGAGCFLSCDGNTTGAEPVTYKWRSGGTKKLKDVTKDDSVHIKDFICEMENPVSQDTSDPVFNPFYRSTPGEETDGTIDSVKVSTGVTVFICLLSAVLVLVFVHRWKAGEWFFQKESLPFEADFWRKQDSQPRDNAESNGTTSRQEPEHTDESPMNKA
ncbi:cell adhesion molecule CEACAM21 isoform X3 [Halichoeres trimaculatus]|uniref:cell adhesion molecule CEACAM21 isoform X3 n=1 Tax=Halichoeres trimaculatus TaxID=147232 RepID=UPI003D9E067F